MKQGNNIYGQVTNALHESDYLVAICSAAYKKQLDASQPIGSQDFPAAIATRALHEALEKQMLRTQQVIWLLCEKEPSKWLPSLLILDNVDALRFSDSDTYTVKYAELLERLVGVSKEQPRILLTSRDPSRYLDRSLPVKIPSVQIQLTIDQDFDSYTKQELEELLTKFEDLLDLRGRIRVVNIENGSVKVTLELPLEQAEQLLWLYKRGAFKEKKHKGCQGHRRCCSSGYCRMQT